MQSPSVTPQFGENCYTALPSSLAKEHIGDDIVRFRTLDTPPSSLVDEHTGDTTSSPSQGRWSADSYTINHLYDMFLDECVKPSDSGMVSGVDLYRAFGLWFACVVPFKAQIMVSFSMPTALNYFKTKLGEPTEGDGTRISWNGFIVNLV